MRLIDADKLLKADENSDKILVLGSGKSLELAYALMKKKVENAPTVDAVPVIRCKDCKYHEDEEPGMVYCPNLVGGWVGENWFCADGERGYEEAGGRKVKVIYNLGESDEWWHEKLCQLKEGHIQLTENDQEIIRAVKAEAKREGIRRALIKKGLLPDKEM